MGDIIYLKEFSYEIIKDGECDSVIYFFMAERIQLEPVRNVEIVLVYPYDWNSQMTPWKHIGKGMEKTGEGDRFIEAFRDIFDSKYKKRYIGGYSLGGLMAMYMAYRCDGFDGAASVSGSMWYPGAIEFFSENFINENIKKVYISLGRKEALTKNSERAAVEVNTVRLVNILEKKCETVFEMNEGGHFTDIVKRVEKAIMALT